MAQYQGTIIAEDMLRTVFPEGVAAFDYSGDTERAYEIEETAKEFPSSPLRRQGTQPLSTDLLGTFKPSRLSN